MNKWKYKVAIAKPSIWSKEEDKAATIEETLARLGMENWELVNVIPNPGYGSVHLYLKRPY